MGLAAGLGGVGHQADQAGLANRAAKEVVQGFLQPQVRKVLDLLEMDHHGLQSRPEGQRRGHLGGEGSEVGGLTMRAGDSQGLVLGGQGVSWRQVDDLAALGHGGRQRLGQG